MDRSNKKLNIVYKCPTANTSAMWQQTAHTIDQLASPAAKQEPYKKKKKSLPLNEKN